MDHYQAAKGLACPPGQVSGITTAVRDIGQLKQKIENLNRLANLLSEDMSGFSIEIDRISGCRPADPSKGQPERPASCDLESFQEQLDRLDRLAQFVHQQLDRLRAI